MLSVILINYWGKLMENNKENVVDDDTLVKRSLFARICFTILWFLPIVVVINMLVGAIVGGFTGGSGTTFQEGYNAGAIASANFFENYGQIVFGIELVIWLGLSYFGILPGTAKFKKK